MNESQRSHVETYLPELTHSTFLSTMFLSKLQTSGFLNEADLDILEAERHDNGTVAECKRFYEIMMEKTVSGTYEAILNAVRSTHQSKALKILEKVPQLKKNDNDFF